MNEKTRAKVLLVCPDLSLQGGVSSYYRTIRKYLPQDVEFMTVGMREHSESILQFAKRMIADYWRFVFTLIRGKFDLVHLNPSLGKYSVPREAILVIITKLLGIRIIVFFRGWDENFEKRLKRWFSWPFVKVYGLADLFVVLGTQFQKSLHTMGINKPILLASTIVDDSVFSKYEIEHLLDKRRYAIDFNIIFLSRVEEAKGIFLALDAFSILKKIYKKARLTIVGHGSRYNDAINHCDEWLRKDVIFCGHLEGEEKYRMLSDASCYFLPTYGEGMPNSVLEAMAFGLPVITRAVGGIKDFFEDGEMGYVTESLDPEVFSNLIGMLIENPLRCEEMGRYNRDYSFSHFRASKAAEKLLSFYEMVSYRQCNQ